MLLAWTVQTTADLTVVVDTMNSKSSHSRHGMEGIHTKQHTLIIPVNPENEIIPRMCIWNCTWISSLFYLVCFGGLTRRFKFTDSFLCVGTLCLSAMLFLCSSPATLFGTQESDDSSKNCRAQAFIFQKKHRKTLPCATRRKTMENPSLFIWLAVAMRMPHHSHTGDRGLPGSLHLGRFVTECLEQFLLFLILLQVDSVFQEFLLRQNASSSSGSVASPDSMEESWGWICPAIWKGLKKQNILWDGTKIQGCCFQSILDMVSVHMSGFCSQRTLTPVDGRSPAN